MLSIRLTRVGKKKYPLYRIVIQEKSKDPWGKALEILGNYNPHTKDLAVKKDRIEYWRSVGAQLSASLNNLLINKKIITGSKMKAAKLNKKKEGGEEKKAEPKIEAVKEANKQNETKNEEIKENHSVKEEEKKAETKPTEEAKV